MQTKTLQQTVTFRKPPRKRSYDMLMDSKKHQSLSGEPAKISRKVGGKFTAWGTHLSGINLVLKPGKKIVQAWRATGWWPDHYSIAIFDITKVRGGSKLKFTQIGIPPTRYSGHYRGWIETYSRTATQTASTVTAGVGRLRRSFSSFHARSNDTPGSMSRSSFSLLGSGSAASVQPLRLE